ncbi:unnamed protein product [Parascedosporium putredinis]|uniref:Uncharacterized protein n=1 Tax=Parascedosporium putredinis TaxID=1442378 RepID=A0A9P1H232_9PEZI|nr:unnamed protein product [Parascedosporium putredinis]CAI7995724.1 unnamed protein product [Parascedosporium putredinis]
MDQGQLDTSNKRPRLSMSNSWGPGAPHGPVSLPHPVHSPLASAGQHPTPGQYQPLYPPRNPDPHPLHLHLPKPHLYTNIGLVTTLPTLTTVVTMSKSHTRPCKITDNLRPLQLKLHLRHKDIRPMVPLQTPSQPRILAATL